MCVCVPLFQPFFKCFSTCTKKKLKSTGVYTHLCLTPLEMPKDLIVSHHIAPYLSYYHASNG